MTITKALSESGICDRCISPAVSKAGWATHWLGGDAGGGGSRLLLEARTIVLCRLRSTKVGGGV